MKVVIIFLAFLTLTMTSNAQAALVKSYDFNGNLSDSLGNGDDLTQNNGGAVANGFFNVGLNTGLRLTNAFVDNSDYAIEMRMKITDNLSSWKKIIDFREFQTDNGFYVYFDDFDFYVSGGQIFQANLSLNEFFTFSFERANNTVSLFLNNSLLGSFSDASNEAIPPQNILNFFQDDPLTSQREAFEGQVDYIRIHENRDSFGQDPTNVPEPATIGLFAFMLIFMRTIAKKYRF